MHLFLVGVSHRTAPVELRERLDFSSRDVGAAVEALATRLSAEETVVLSTCNRSEIYVASTDPNRSHQDVIGFLSDYHQIPEDVFLPHVFTRRDHEAARHLFRVAAGLDSIVVGEPQILGQVKDALQAARERHCAGPLLNRTFDWALNVGKRVRSETALGEGAVSIAYAALSPARKIFGKLQGLTVLVIGAGEISTLTAQHLRNQGVSEIVITSRTAAHAEALAQTVSGRAIPWADMPTALAHADIIVTATGAQRPIITRKHIEAVTGRKRSGPLFIVDLAVPRDVESSVGDIEQVFLYNVDDLQGIVQENISRRSGEIEHAEQIVTGEVSNFIAWHRSRAAVPTIRALRDRFEGTRRTELERLKGKLSGLPPEAVDKVDEITRLLVEKLLLEPTEQLKALPDEETQAVFAEALNRLFRLRDDAGGSTRSPESITSPKRRPNGRSDEITD
jgi:glutamyl-tRNA reductase